MVLASIGLPLLSAVLAGITNIIAKELLDDIPVEAFVTLSFTAIAAVMTPIGALFFQFSQPLLAVPLVAGIILLDGAANYLFFTGMNVQEVSRNEAVAAFSPLFTAILAGIVLPQHLTPHIAIAVAAIVTSLYLLNTDTGVSVRTLQLRENYLPLLGALLFGASAIVSRFALAEYAVTNPETLYWLRAIALAAMFWIIFRPNIRDTSTETIALISGRGVLVIGQWLAFLYALQLSNVVVSTTLARTAPLFTLVFAVLVLDDTLTRRKLGAILLTVAAIAFLTVRTTFI